MPSAPRRKALTLPELVVVLVALALLVSLAIVAIRSSRESTRRNECANKLRRIGSAFSVFGGHYTRYPAACEILTSEANPARDCRPADASGAKSTTGYSFIACILPMIDETNLYNAISQRSKRFTISTGPFTSSISFGDGGFQHVSCVPISALVCPAWGGDGYTNAQKTIDVGPTCGAPMEYGAPEYANIDSNTPGVGGQSFKGKVAVSNYKPMVGTHMKDGVPVGNGGVAIGPSGLLEADIRDGTSRTIFFCETKESSYASWYDGTLNWLVANDPNKVAPGSSATPDSPPWVNASPALNRGFDPKTPGSVPYLKKSLTANSPFNDVWWGPSSDHGGGIVNHVYGDGHTFGISDDCDATIYLNLTTRDGSEPIDEVLTSTQTTTTSGASR